MKPFTDLGSTIFSASFNMFIESIDWIKAPSKSKLKESVGDLPKLTDVESSLYIYLELLRTGGFRFDMKFPFANRRGWIDIIAETVESHYQEIMLNTAIYPDESIELWNISAEFYPVKSRPSDREDILLQLQPHTADSFEDTNIVLTISSEYNIPREYLMWMTAIHEHVEQLWQGHLQFSRQNLIHVVSLQGECKQVFVQTVENNTNATINIHWMKTTNQKFHFYTDARLVRSWRNHYCFKYVTSDSDKPWDVLPSLDFAFIYQITIFYEQKTGFRGTWLEAYELCKRFDGFLPILRSREELDQLISVLKLPMVPPPPMKIMFIGLIIHQVRKVFK